MKFCPQCGTTFEPEARFCLECGFDKTTVEQELSAASSMPETSEPKMVSPVFPPVERAMPETEHSTVCPGCRQPINPEDRFCQECGYDVSAIIPVIPEVSPSPPEEFKEIISIPINETVTEIVSSSNPFCQDCGAAMETGDVFCLECGAKTSDINTETPEAPPPIQPVEVNRILTEPLPETSPLPIDGNAQFCPNCGVTMAQDDVFCQECGYKSGAHIEGPSVNTTVIPPVIEKPVAVAPAKPAKDESEVFVATPPPLPAVKQAVLTQTPEPSDQAAPPSAGKKKSLLVILLAVLALAVIGAGSWFAYDKFIKKANLPVVDSTAIAIQQEPVAVAEPEINDTANLSLKTEVENPVSGPQKTASNKQNTPKKTTPKKQTPDPKKNEPARNEPLKNDEPVKVKIKPVESKTGRVILSIINDKEVKSGPLFATKLKLDGPFIITKITTFHYNWGKGAQPGTISLQKRKDTYGPWQARGIAGDDGTPNGKWVCEPNVRLEEGTYKVEVSDEKSWSYNGQSSQKGFVVIEGYEAD